MSDGSRSKGVYKIGEATEVSVGCIRGSKIQWPGSQVSTQGKEGAKVEVGRRD